MRIQALEVEAFRGFNNKKRFDFSGLQVIIVSGPNGHGKTSLFDAIEWGLTGDLHRFEVGTDGRNQSRFVGNLFAADKGLQPTVRLELRDDQNQLILVTRVGTASKKVKSDYASSELRVRGPEDQELVGMVAEEKLRSLLIREEWRNKANFSRDLQLTHLLGQEQISRFLRGLKGRERYDALSVLFGTDEFSRYEELFDEARGLLRARIQQQEKLRDTSKTKLTLMNAELDRAKAKLPTEGTANKEQTQEFLQKLGLSLESVDKHLLEARQAELVQARSRFLTEHEEPLQLALTSAQSASLDRQKVQDRAERVSFLQEMVKVGQEQEEVLWLLEHFAEFASGSEKRNAWLAEVFELQKQYERHLEASEAYQKFATLVKAASQSTKEIEVFFAGTYGAGIEDEARGRAENLLKALRVSYELEPNLRGELQKIEKSRVGWEAELSLIVGLNEKYQHLLRSALAYLAERPDLEDCPVCGAPDRTTEEMMNFLSAQQETVHPQLPLLNQHILGVKAEKERLEGELERARRAIEAAKMQVEEFVQDLQGAAKSNQAASAGLQESRLLLQSHIESSEGTWRLYREKSERLGYNVEGLLEADLLGRKASLAERLQTAGVERSAVMKLLKDAQDELGDAQTSLEVLKTRLQRLGASSEVLESWQDEDLSRFLETVGRAQQIRKSEIQVQEELLLQAMQSFSKLEVYQEYQKAKGRVKEQEGQLKKIERSIRELESTAELMRTSKTAVPGAINNLNQRVLDNLRTTIQEIFCRLNSHPLYRTLDFKYQFRFNSNYASFAVGSEMGDSKVEANPSFIFSSAQVNSVAISFFLAMALQQQWSPLRFVGMDDPVQSMDDLNVIALVDLIRVLCSPIQHGKQFLISTHDPAFLKIMLRKFRYLSVGVIEYQGYGQEGPVLEAYSDAGRAEQYVRRVTPKKELRVEKDMLLLKDKPLSF